MQRTNNGQRNEVNNKSPDKLGAWLGATGTSQLAVGEHIQRTNSGQRNEFK